MYSENGHFEAARRLNALHLFLGTAAAIGSAVGGLTIIAEVGGTLGPGLVALAAGASAALITFAKPQEKADVHHNAGTQYAAMRGRLRRLRVLDLPVTDESSKHTLRDRFEELAEHKADLDSAGPAIPRYAYLAARRVIKRGEPDYTVDAGTAPNRK